MQLRGRGNWRNLSLRRITPLKFVIPLRHEEVDTFVYQDLDYLLT